MLLTRTKLGIALVLALGLGVGFVAHQTLTAQPSPEQRPSDPTSPAQNNFFGGVRDGQNQETPPDVDRHLADLEKRLEGALNEVRALRQAMKASKAGMTTFPLKHASAVRAAEVLRAAYPDGQLRITTDNGTNSVTVHAGAADTQAVRRLLEALDSKKEGQDTKPGDDVSPRK